MMLVIYDFNNYKALLLLLLLLVLLLDMTAVPGGYGFLSYENYA